jgi:hypothetical protein
VTFGELSRVGYAAMRVEDIATLSGAVETRELPLARAPVRAAALSAELRVHAAAGSRILKIDDSRVSSASYRIGLRRPVGVRAGVRCARSRGGHVGR